MNDGVKSKCGIGFQPVIAMLHRLEAYPTSAETTPWSSILPELVRLSLPKVTRNLFARFLPGD